KWEGLFKRRELVHTDVVKEFYAKLIMSHNRKKDVAKSKVRGVEIAFDHLQLASILVFEKFGVPLVDKKGEEPKKYDFFEETFLTMCKLTRENGVWWIGTGENRRRDDDDVAPEEETEEEEKDQTEFDWEAVVDEAAVEGESGSGEKFYDAEDEVQGSPAVNDDIPAMVTQASAQQKEPASSGVDPSCPSGHLPEGVMNKLQAEFERARANRFQADLEKAHAENARLLALLQQAQFKPKP
ncbi:hypothetical protein Dimus_015357, partial [Dionaea muscipula]